ncbi:MAG TPA: cation transporter [Paludibacteraceae bacterium]|nr:cation transporter [Paludibacteraceae bacterium]
MKKMMISILLMLAATTVVHAEKQTVVLAVNQMECGTCQAKVEKTLAYEKGVKGLQFDLEKRQVTITFDNEKTTVEKLQNALVKNNKYASEIVKPSCAKPCQSQSSGCAKMAEKPASKCCSGR